VDRERIDETVTWLLHHDYRPETSGGDEWRRTPDGLPLCPRHGVVMTRRMRQGDEWFSHKVVDQHGQERYCRGYRTSSENDGYAL
jgi:hypothetical protein